MFNLPIGKSRMWRLESLADFARVALWLDTKRQKGNQYAALSQYFKKTTPVLSDSLDEYIRCVEELDMLTGGVFSSGPKQVTAGDPKPTPLQTLHSNAKELRIFFDTLQSQKHSQFTTQWMDILNSKQDFYHLLRRLVGDFGNFEGLVPLLPPTGSIITNPKIQKLLDKMYKINTRNIRILEMIYDVSRSWRNDPIRANYGFVDPRTYCNQLIGSIMLEYMIEADPVRVKKRMNEAKQSGNTYIPYRFWRPAENLKLMAQVKYSEDKFRKPTATRKYIDLQLAYVPPICTDNRRFQWAIREILNNCLAASSKMYIGPTGKWIAQPLPRHDCENPDPAIVVTLEEAILRQGLRKHPVFKLTIRDEGTGIAPEHLPHLPLWGYSPRRAEFLDRAQKSRDYGSIIGQEIRIGGKGIGLAFAVAVIQEHGGTVKIDSELDEGTTVTVTIPVPTSLVL